MSLHTARRRAVVQRTAEFCALIAADMALLESRLRLLERKMDLADAMREACPSHAEIGSLVLEEANDAMNTVYDRTDLLTSERERHCAGGGD